MEPAVANPAALGNLVLKQIEQTLSALMEELGDKAPVMAEMVVKVVLSKVMGLLLVK